MFSHEDFGIYYWFFTYLLLIPYKHRGKCQVTIKGLFFLILSERTLAKFDYWTLEYCALNNHLHLNTDLLSTYHQLWQIFMKGSVLFLWILMTFLANNLKVLLFVFSYFPPHSLLLPSPSFSFLFLVHWVYESER